ncbi:MAG TPA: putative transporter [Muribaculum sp.]|jgi:putative transport protein|uniref:Transporter n=1 Tax=Heminiphilus faecis TaxID=2601703 RepID=A0ABV4D2U4_9BACT|nr:putative transporter [Heminiphilus faecis]RLT75506.1 putative transporter [bacterium J10(2018)]HRF69644.1 putative transporter [Muribaculum sp.]
MDWIQQLLSPGNTALASTIVLYSFVIAVGVFLGKLKIGGVSLGVTFVLFVGLVMGHFGYKVNSEVLHFIREFGLILFIFSIGLQVGPGFFSSFKKGGMLLNGLAVLIIMLNVAIVLGIFFIDGNTSITALVGVMSGAVTNTPGLGAAQQAILQVNPDAYTMSEEMAMGYAAAYPLGVIGIILSMFIIRAIFRVKMDKEIKLVEEDNDNSQLKPHIVTFEVTNPLIEGKNLVQLHDIISCNFVISRLKDQEGNVIIPNSQTVIHLNDKLYIVMSAQDEERFKAVIGPEIDMDWEATPSPVISRRIVITKSEYNGVPVGALRLRMGYHLNATRVNRAGVDLLASPNLRLQVGDRMTVVGQEADIKRLAEKLGNSMKRLNEPNMITLFVGIFLGIVVGSIPIAFPGVSVPMKLGLAGGPLVVAILISRFGYKIKLVTYTSSSASLLMREIGICLFLASVGIASGAGFASTVFNYTGMWWVIWGFIITVVPLLVVGIIARGIYKINLLTIMGLFGGGMTDPPALAYANNSTGNDAPAVAYSTVYPLTMFLRVVAAQVLVLCLA